jgi:hypothetical protein
MTVAFIKTMRPLTAGERMAFSAYLSLPLPAWPAAREMFERSEAGVPPSENVLEFAIVSGVSDPEITGRIEAALQALAKERTR